MRFCFVSTRRGSPFMTELLSAVSAATASAGHTVDFALDEFPPLHDGGVYVVIPHEFHAWGDPRGFPDPGQRARTIALCTENPGTEWFEATRQLAPQFAAAMSINRASAAELRRLGIRCEHLQLGYTPLWDSWLGDPSAERQIDVLYLGAADPRRDPLLGGCGRHLWRRECQFLVPPLEPRRRPRPDYLSGAEKYDRLRSARVLLNLHRTTSAALEWMRFLEAICNGCVVVSEPCLDPEPLVPGEHFVTASADSIALVVDQLLDEPEELLRLRLRAYDFVRKELPMGHAVDQLAELAAELPLKPLDTELPPQPLDAELPPQPFDAELPPQPFDAGLPPQPLDTRGPALMAGAAPAQQTRAPVQNASASSTQAREPRRLLRHISQRVSRARRPRAGIRAQTPTYATATPRVSVAVAVHGRKRDAVEALASVAASRCCELEALILDDTPDGRSVDDTPDGRSADDAPDGRSVAAVRGFLDDHPWLPAALLRHPANRGLADSRNTLAERARGEYVFILDADGGIYPSALERLVTALDADPQATFSYPMVAVFDGDGPVELLSSLPWEPERLKSGNWIDAMALIRRERLLELGGYATDPRLAGWEDFHLWCQCAEAGSHGVLVPQVLGWHRRAASSTPRTETGTHATWALMQARFPQLLEGSGERRPACGAGTRIPTQSSAIITAMPMTMTNAESDARQILKTVWAPDSDGAPIPLPVDPFVIAQKLGIKAYAAGLDEGISGMLVKRAGEDPEIYVHASDSPNRRRFTCAHELGHYYKRSATDDTEWEYVEHRDLLTSEGTNPEEIYANKFAASLLMPREEVERRWTEGQRLPAIAYEFGVSEDAMRYRLDNLGLK